MVSAGRFYRGRLLHLADGTPTPGNAGPIERVTFCGLRLSTRWFERLNTGYGYPYCGKCVRGVVYRSPGVR